VTHLPALIGNIAEVAPAGIVTEAGTVAVDGSLLPRAMTAPPLGAGPLSCTMPVHPEPPGMLDTSVTRLTRVAGDAVKDATCVILPEVAVIVIEVVFATALVVIAKEAVFDH
jgi:hypothetical protein